MLFRYAAGESQLQAPFGGRLEEMRRSACATLARLLAVDLGSWDPVTRKAFDNFAVLATVIPDVAEWPIAQHQALIDIIRAKAGPDEIDYLRLLQKHTSLRDALLRVGSEPV